MTNLPMPIATTATIGVEGAYVQFETGDSVYGPLPSVWQTAASQDCCSTATEDGTFQFTGNSAVVSGTTLNLYLKSDLDVPEQPLSFCLAPRSSASA